LHFYSVKKNIKNAKPLEGEGFGITEPTLILKIVGRPSLVMGAADVAWSGVCDRSQKFISTLINVFPPRTTAEKL